MHVSVQKSTRTTWPRSSAGMSGSELSHAVAPSIEGMRSRSVAVIPSLLPVLAMVPLVRLRWRPWNTLARSRHTDHYGVGMQCRINGATVHFVEHGAGSPLVALHGAGVDHREIEAAVEAVVPASGYRRIYPDLPGMGRSTADGLNSNDDVVDLLGALIDQLAGGPALLVGHSYGAYLARGVAARARTPCSAWRCSARPPKKRGRSPSTRWCARTPTRTTSSDPNSERASTSTSSYAQRRPLVATATTSYRARRSSTRPGSGASSPRGRSTSGRGPFTSPTLIAAGRRDSAVGYADAVDLVEHYPHGTLAVIEGAGHALMHERPELLAALVGDWLDRARPDAR